MAIFTGTLSERSPRYEDWIRVFGSGTVPLLSPATVEASAPGIARAQFYRLAVAQLTREQRERLVDRLSRRFGIPRAEVERDIDDPEIGVPILADDVCVLTDARAFL